MKAYTREWVTKAERDRLVAIESLDLRPRVYDIVCFHCQQCAEKYLKALLFEQGLAIPKTHDLLRLIDLIAPKVANIVALRRPASQLTEFAVEYRYPGLDATRRQAVSALKKMDRMRQTIRQELGLRDRP